MNRTELITIQQADSQQQQPTTNKWKCKGEKALSKKKLERTTNERTTATATATAVSFWYGIGGSHTV
jgi:hypothetical protein